MATLASAVAIGDTQLLLNASLAGDFPAYVKVDDEVLPVGGVGATGTVLALSEPAQATHNQGATVTYAGRPYDADFLAATAGEGGGGGESTILSAVINLTAGQIATLSSVPVEVVAAPGAGKVIVPVSAVFQYVAGAVGFTNPAGLDLLYGDPAIDGAGMDTAPAEIEFGNLDPIVAVFSRPTGMLVGTTACDNQALMVEAATDPDGAGDGTARLQVLYYVMDLA